MPVWVPDGQEAWKPGQIVDVVPNAERKSSDLRSLTSRSSADSLLGARTSAGSKTSLLDQGSECKEIVTLRCDGVVRDLNTVDQQAALRIREAAAMKTRGVDAGDDLDALPFLHEPSVLQALQARFLLDRGYTRLGPVMLSCLTAGAATETNNGGSAASVSQTPLGKMNSGLKSGMKQGSTKFAASSSSSSSIYSKAQEYIRENARIVENTTPHICGLAMDSFYAMYNKGRSQIVLITGESGSGKSYNAEAVLKCLTYLKEDRNQESKVSAALNAVEPLLRAFGNAHTVRNRDSSCYGRLTELFYPMSNRGNLQAGRLETFLLQKGRISDLNQSERNFHIFYQYAAALHFCGKQAKQAAFGDVKDTMNDDPEQDLPVGGSAQSLGVGGKTRYEYVFRPDGGPNATTYHFIPFEGASTGVVPKMLSGGGIAHDPDDFPNFDATLHAFCNLGVPVEEQEEIFNLLTAILLLSCVSTANANARDPSASRSSSRVAKIEESAKNVRIAVLAKILGVSDEARLRQICENSDAVDSLSRLLYGQVFKYIVHRCNDALSASLQEDALSNASEFASVSVLDMFGFGSYRKNGFEQLCTNYANEVMRKYIFSDVRTWTSATYSSTTGQQIQGQQQGVLNNLSQAQLDSVNENHDAVVSLIRTGIFPLLESVAKTAPPDDVSLGLFSRQLDQQFCSRVRSSFGAGKNPRFLEKRNLSDSFAIRHFTSDVTYTVSSFAHKNSDPYLPELVAFLREQNNVTEAASSPFSRKSKNADGAAKTRTSRIATGPNHFLQTLLRDKTLVETESKNLRSQLDRVMALVDAGERHFCVCLRPNGKSVPDFYHRNYVADQLRMQGVMEIVDLQRSVLPVRLDVKEFLVEFGGLKTYMVEFGQRPNVNDSQGGGNRGSKMLASSSKNGGNAKGKVSLAKQASGAGPRGILRRGSTAANSVMSAVSLTTGLARSGASQVAPPSPAEELLFTIAEANSAVEELVGTNKDGSDAQQHYRVVTTTQHVGSAVRKSGAILLSEELYLALKQTQYDAQNANATRLSAAYRQFLTKRRYDHIRASTVKLQRWMRDFLSLKTKRKFQSLIGMLRTGDGKKVKFPFALPNSALMAAGKSGGSTAVPSDTDAEVERHVKEIADERARMQQQQMDLMHALHKSRAAKAEGESAGPDNGSMMYYSEPRRGSNNMMFYNNYSGGSTRSSGEETVTPRSRSGPISLDLVPLDFPSATSSKSSLISSSRSHYSGGSGSSARRRMTNGAPGTFQFYLDGDDIVDTGDNKNNSTNAQLSALFAAQQAVSDCIKASKDSKLQSNWDKLQISLKDLARQVEEGPMKSQYIIERRERELRHIMYNERQGMLELVRRKLGNLVNLNPMEAARRARQGITNVDLEFSIDQLKRQVRESVEGVSEEERKKLNSGEEMFENFDFAALSPIWTERLVRNLRKIKKPVDVLILGPKNVGKTELVRRMYHKCDLKLPAAFIDPKTSEEMVFATLGGREGKAPGREDPEHLLPDILRHDFDFGGNFYLRVLDCHARLSESSLYRNLYHQAHWVFIVYTVTRQETVQQALALLREAKKFNNNVLLVGNLIYEAETVKATTRNVSRRVAAEPREVNLNYVKARADKHKGIVMETSDLLVATKLAVESMMAPSEVVKYVPAWKDAAHITGDKLPIGLRRAEHRKVEDELKKEVRDRLKGVVDTAKPSLAEHEAESSYVKYPLAEQYDYNFLTLIDPKEDIAHKELLTKARLVGEKARQGTAPDPKVMGGSHREGEKPDGEEDEAPESGGGMVLKTEGMQVYAGDEYLTERVNYHDDGEGRITVGKEDENQETDYEAGRDRDLVLIEKRKPKAPSAITCVCFGMENRVKPFSYLVAGYKDGHIALYRIYHTETDYELIHMASEEEVGVEESTEYMKLVQMMKKELKSKNAGKLEHVATWKAHQRAVTNVVFTTTEQKLISISTDKTMRLWNLEVEHGHFVQHGHPKLHYVVEDAYPISAVCTVPAFPQLYILANAAGGIRVGDYVEGKIIQKFSHIEEVRCLAIDRRNGNYMFGGTKFGEVFVIDCERPGDFKFLPNLSIRINQTWMAATDMRFGSLVTLNTTDKLQPNKPMAMDAAHISYQDLLVVNCADNSVVTCQVTYESRLNRILTFTVLHRYPNLQTVLPLRSCISSHGYVITAGEDRHVHVHTIHDPKHVCSLLHDEPCIAVDLNRSHTILASGDVLGNLYVWRCYSRQGTSYVTSERMFGSGMEEEPDSGSGGPASGGSADGEGAKKKLEKKMSTQGSFGGGGGKTSSKSGSSSASSSASEGPGAGYGGGMGNKGDAMRSVMPGFGGGGGNSSSDYEEV
ncbi:unnamed protein product [Amoebophrya sp. A25]|nr:unnamed protein product [Amoebophrya sp. A25]|eukprot:GSA25T00009402001.1